MSLSFELSSNIRQTCNTKLRNGLDNCLRLNTSLSGELRKTRSSRLRKIPRCKRINSLGLGISLSTKFSTSIRVRLRNRHFQTNITSFRNTIERPRINVKPRASPPLALRRIVRNRHCNNINIAAFPMSRNM